MSMKKYSLKPILTLACMLVCLAASAQVKLPVKTDNAPFFLHDGKIPEHVNDLAIHYVSKGTTATIFGWSDTDSILKVMLEDGSIGYMPTIAFTFEKNLRFKDTDYKPKDYRLIGIGKWKDYNDNPSLIPEYYRCLIEQYSEIRNLYTSGIDADISYWHTGRSSLPIFKSFYERYTEIDTNLVKTHKGGGGTRYKLRKDEMPMNFIGCSRSCIESIIGPAYGYVGHELSPYAGYSYAFYNKVVWDIPHSNMNTVGCFVFYDKNMVAVHIEKRFMWESYSDDIHRCYQPLRALKQQDTLISSLLAQTPTKVDKLVCQAIPNETSVIVSPPLYERWRLKILYSHIFYVILVLLIVFSLHFLRLKKLPKDSSMEFIINCVNGILICMMVWQVLRIDSFYSTLQDTIRWFICILGDRKILLFLMTIITSISYVLLWKWVLLRTIFRAGSSVFLVILAFCLTVTFVKAVVLSLWEYGVLLTICGGLVALAACFMTVTLVGNNRCSRCGTMVSDDYVERYSACCPKCGYKWSVLHFWDALSQQ